MNLKVDTLMAKWNLLPGLGIGGDNQNRLQKKGKVWKDSFWGWGRGWCGLLIPVLD